MLQSGNKMPPTTSMGCQPWRRCSPRGGELLGFGGSSKQLPVTKARMARMARMAKMTVLGSKQLLSTSREIQKLSGKLSGCR